jgi:hypothetical protein
MFNNNVCNLKIHLFILIFFFRSPIQEYFLKPNILRVLISYLKYYQIRKAAYLYDNEGATRRIYDLLQLMNNDEYFDDFSLDIRTIDYEDVYSLLYSIESNSLHKDQPPRYILLDLESSYDYERMFEKISHMGLYSILILCSSKIF